MLVGLGNPFITTGDSHTSHSFLLVPLSIISLPFVGILNTVITPLEIGMRPPVPANFSLSKTQMRSNSAGAPIIDVVLLGFTSNFTNCSISDSLIEIRRPYSDEMMMFDYKRQRYMSSPSQTDPPSVFF